MQINLMLFMINLEKNYKSNEDFYDKRYEIRLKN